MQDSVKVTKVQPYCRMFIHSMCIASCLFTSQVLYDALEAQTQGLVTMIIMNIWSPNTANCAASTPTEKKDILIGGTKLLLESKVASNPEVWKSLLSSLIPLTSEKQDLSFTFDEDEQEEIKGFDTTYSKLSYATIYTSDVNGEIPSATQFFITSLSQFTRNHPGQYSSLVSQLKPEQQTELQGLLQKYNVGLM
jgi:hypothetical protein